MYSWSRAMVYGMLLWALTFVIMFILYPVRLAALPLFVSLRTITLVLGGVFFAMLYFRDAEEGLLREGFSVGMLWLLLSVIFDQVPYVAGGMKMTLLDYVRDMGLNYLIYPIVTVGASALLSSVLRIEGPAESEEGGATEGSGGESKSKGHKKILSELPGRA